MLLIDPPSGWKYGFPKPYTRSGDETLEGWLVKNGYPQEEIDKYGEARHCRFLGSREELNKLTEKDGMIAVA